MSSYLLSAGGLKAGLGLFGGIPPPQALPLIQPGTVFPQVPAHAAQPAPSRQAVRLVLSLLFLQRGFVGPVHGDARLSG